MKNELELTIGGVGSW